MKITNKRLIKKEEKREEFKKLFIIKLEKPKTFRMGKVYTEKYEINWRWRDRVPNKKTLYAKEKAERLYYCIDIKY